MLFTQSVGYILHPDTVGIERKSYLVIHTLGQHRMNNLKTLGKYPASALFHFLTSLLVCNF